MQMEKYMKKKKMALMIKRKVEVIKHKKMLIIGLVRQAKMELEL